MAETNNNIDPKLQEFQAKLSAINEEKNSIASYVTSYRGADGFFNIDKALLESGGTFMTALDALYEDAKEIRKVEDVCDDKGSTYVIVVKDPKPVYSTRNPKNWTIDDVIYYKYTEPYTDASKQKEKDVNGKTPLKRFQIMDRNLKNSPKYKEAKKLWKEGCKTYTTWVKYIDQYRKLEQKERNIKEQQKTYEENKTKKEEAQKQKEAAKEQRAVARENAKEQRAEDKLNNSKAVSTVREKLRTYTDCVNGPSFFIKEKGATFFLNRYYKPYLGEVYSQEYARLELLPGGSKYEKEVEQFNKAKAKAAEVLTEANKTLENFKTAFSENKKAEPNYKEVEKVFNQFDSIAKALISECYENQHKVEESITKKQEAEIQEAQQSSGEADKELNKKELGDNLSPKTIEGMKNMQTVGKGGLDGKSTSPGMAGGAGSVNGADIAGSCSKASSDEEKNEEKKDPNKYPDENKWTDEEIAKIKGEAAGLSQQQIASSSVQMTDVLANVATNIVGAFATDPMLANQVTGLISTGTFNAQSIEGMGNMMLASSVNTLTNAMMNATGAASVEEAMNDALSATATIITTATNIVPTIKELTVATVMTVTDELTSHITEKVESILDPSAITDQITYYMGYFTSLYTASADDLKKKLLSPGDAAISDALDTKTEDNKNAKMNNMMAKITDLKNKASDGIAMAKAGVKMITTYINNGPDWVIKQLSTYTNFAIAQVEKYIDYGADYVIDQRDSFVAMIGESIGKRVAEQVNKVQEQTLKKALDYIEVKKKYAVQVAMAAIMTAVQVVVGLLGPQLGMLLKMGAKMGMKQLLKTIGG